MRYLLDTGILVRLVNRQAAAHAQIRQAIRQLKRDGHTTVTSFQNLSEFWNVCTRPASTSAPNATAAEIYALVRRTSEAT